MQQEDRAVDALDIVPAERDEITWVLAALRGLLARASNPIVRACLEEAHDDIAHLTGRDDGEDQEGAAVA
jgi:hypothetical protein